jgi:putative CocE/NonD family hydrolase
MSLSDCAVKMEFGVKIPMRDGIELSADIYRPNAQGKFPVILERTPYSSMDGENQKKVATRGKFFANRGFVFVYQDCRGKNESNGVFYPLVNEAEDGYDTQQWCGTQLWSNGNVGTYGASYAGWNQWLAACLANEHLKTMVSIAAPPDPFLNCPYQNGALWLWMAAWSVLVTGKKNRNLQVYDSVVEILDHLPIITLDQAFGMNIPFWKDWITHYTYDAYWEKVSYQDRYNEIKVPVLHITGWYDSDEIGNHLNYVGMKKEAGTELARKNQRIIIGPWHHAVNTSSKIADMDFGPDAIINLDDIVAKWFYYWLKRKDPGIRSGPPASIFIMGENRWREENDWPLARTRYTKFYLHSSGRANTLYGDGELSTRTPRTEPTDQFVYDPESPVPDIAPETYPERELAPSGAEDQTPVERRDDVLVYTSQVLRRNLEVTGPISLKLYASSTAKDTDFTGKLVDVFPNRYAMRLSDGIQRARFRDSYERPALLTPQRIYEYTINMWYTGNLFLRGHRIRVEISSSCFPKFDRNPNTGHPFGIDRELRIAKQTVYHDSIHPSHVLLPIIPRH